MIAIPTGPVGLLCVRRTLVNGFKAGAISALGSVSADIFYSSIVVFGLHSISHFLLSYKIILRVIAGFSLIILGAHGLGMKIKNDELLVKDESKWGDFGSTFFLTIANPVLIFSFSLVFSAVGVASFKSLGMAGAFVAAVAVGSFTWWLLFSKAINFIHKKYYRLDLEKINRVSSIAIALTGIVLILTMF